MNNSENINNMVNEAEQNLSENMEDIKKAMNGKNPQDLLDSLPKDKQDYVKQLLNNKEATQKLLSSPQVQMLIKKFKEGK